MYLIRKGNMWLMNYRASGAKEFTASGRLEDIYTCLWGDRKQDARTFDKITEANRLARQLGAEVVFHSKKGE